MMLVGKLLLVLGTLICLNIGILLQTIGYDFIDNMPLFALGTAFIGLGAIFAIVDLVKSYEELSKKRKPSEKTKELGEEDKETIRFKEREEKQAEKPEEQIN